MERTCDPQPTTICDSSLQGWKVIGSGGFGQIHKARHIGWGMDVAIKVLHHDDGSRSRSLLLEEAQLMLQGSSPYVLRVLGVFKGRIPSCGPSTQLGLVMEFMERGSLESLLSNLSGPPPWPLVYRFAHQVALGMNFLHSQLKPLLHLDLKPSNVLLDDGLGVKLADFGLAKVYHSVTRDSMRSMEGGTKSYMPPEAFSLAYKPTQASDVYSYGILLWSIITGEQPYNNAMSSLVQLRIPEGDRPSLEGVDQGQAPGLGDLVELMKECWDRAPALRPSFLGCLKVTEVLFEGLKPEIPGAVQEILTQLDNNLAKDLSTLQISGNTHRSGGVNPSNHVNTGPPPLQETAGGLTSKDQDKQRYIGRPTPQPSKSSHGGPTPSLASLSFSRPTPSPPPNPKLRSTKGPSLPPQYQRCNSSSITLSTSTKNPANITFSNVWGVQFGNNNTMFIDSPDGREAGTPPRKQRHRNPTAPPGLTLPQEQPTGHKDKP